ncbi:Sodium-independent sulfate anion transporter [Hypsibius exemplaris]|uniref:Sodium-independent sulfate anion transporter n=1 Tax=Hypsibius exemplaris TaxID=2072580 RepID=A0A1W0WC32_HYPEX|nr:Sodium-independent sulfate anion transporter [Hypsibius exemplaris]
MTGTFVIRSRRSSTAIPSSSPGKPTVWQDYSYAKKSQPEDVEKIVKTGGDFTWDDVKAGLRGYCNATAWRGRVPVTYWLPKYSKQDFQGDMIAGLTVGLTVVPLALAYAAVADLPLEMGPYSSFMGVFVYAVFGTAKDVTIGPSSIMSLMTSAAMPEGSTVQDRVNYAILLSFYCGLVQLFLGIFNLGFLVNFVSEPVISGFTSASAFIIIYGQVKTVLGLTFGKSTDTVITQTSGYIDTLQNVNGCETLLGMVCIGVLLVMKDIRLPKSPRLGISKRIWGYLGEIIRTIRAVRYGVIIVITIGIGYCISQTSWADRIALIHDVKAGVPPLKPPQLAWPNQTAVERGTAIGPSLPFIILFSSLDAISIAKSFSTQFHYKIIPSQELIALGIANIAGSFVSAFPVTGSFTRSALLSQSGVRTPMGGVWTGAFVLFTIAVISEAFKYVPKSALAAVVVSATINLLDFQIFKELWHFNRKELLPLVTTIVVSFTVSVDHGVLAGVGMSVLLLLYPIARPSIVAHFKGDSAVVQTVQVQAFASGQRTLRITVKPQGALFFPSAEYLKDFFQDSIIQREKPPKSAAFDEEEIVFDGAYLAESDYTTLKALKSIVRMCQRADRVIRFENNTSPEVLAMILPKAAAKAVVEMTGPAAGCVTATQISNDYVMVDVLGSRRKSVIPRTETAATDLNEEEMVHRLRGESLQDQPAEDKKV